MTTATERIEAASRRNASSMGFMGANQEARRRIAVEVRALRRSYLIWHDERSLYAARALIAFGQDAFSSR